MRITAIGGDPALRHGVFVLATWDLGKKPKLLDYKILYEWTKKNAHLSEKSTLAGIQRACRDIVRACGGGKDIYGLSYPVGIDWTSSTGFMGRRITASVLSFFIGYLSREFEVYGFPVVIITPQEVREQLGLPKNVQKPTVWKLLRQMIDSKQKNELSNEIGTKVEEDRLSDVRDALILSYLTAVGRSRSEAS